MALIEKAAKDRKLEKYKCTSYRETNWPEFELWKLLHNFILQNCSSICLYLTINAAPRFSRLYLYELSHDNFCQHQGSNKICPHFWHHQLCRLFLQYHGIWALSYLKFRIVNFLSWLFKSVMRESLGNVNQITENFLISHIRWNKAKKRTFSIMAWLQNVSGNRCVIKILRQ